MDVDKKMSKIAGKIEKLNEEFYELKDYRESLENDMVSLNETYNSFVEKAGL